MTQTGQVLKNVARAAVGIISRETKPDGLGAVLANLMLWSKQGDGAYYANKLGVRLSRLRTTSTPNGSRMRYCYGLEDFDREASALIRAGRICPSTADLFIEHGHIRNAVAALDSPNSRTILGSMLETALILNVSGTRLKECLLLRSEEASAKKFVIAAYEQEEWSEPFRRTR